MAIMRRKSPKKKLKEIWDHLTADEVKVVGSYMLNRQNLPKFQSSKLTQMSRPWPVYDRFVLAVKAIWEAHRKKSDNPYDSPFKACQFTPSLSRLEETADLTEKEMEASGKLFKQLLDFDVDAMGSWAKEVGDKVNDSYGFPKCDYAPLDYEQSGSGIAQTIEELSNKKAAPAEDPEEDETPADAKASKKKTGKGRGDEARS